MVYIFILYKARPPGIYKQDYINELFRRYGDIGDALSAPPLPDWCNGNVFFMYIINFHIISQRFFFFFSNFSISIFKTSSMLLISNVNIILIINNAITIIIDV